MDCGNGMSFTNAEMDRARFRSATSLDMANAWPSCFYASTALALVVPDRQPEALVAAGLLARPFKPGWRPADRCERTGESPLRLMIASS